MRLPELLELPAALRLDLAQHLYDQLLAKGVDPSGPISSSSVRRVRIYVYNAAGLLLALRRRKPDDENQNGPGTWEMVQGKINEGEDPERAAMRELFEETAYRMPDLTSWRALTPYVWEAVLRPGTRKPDIAANPDEEHDTFQWANPQEALQWMGRRVAKAAPVDDIERILRAVAWDDWDGLTRLIAPELGEAASEGVVQGLAEAGSADDAVFAVANADAVDYALARAGDLIDPIMQTTKDGLRRLIGQALVDGWSGEQLAQAITDSALFGPERARRIASWELAHANTQGNLTAWGRSGVVLGKRWLMSNLHDQDDECDANEEVGVIALDALFPSGHSGPPAHPNCACVLVPALHTDDARD